MDRVRSFYSWYQTRQAEPDSLATARVKGYSTLVGAILLHMVIGATTMGNVITYMTSYMRLYVSESNNYGQNIWISSIGVAAFAMFTIIGGYLNRLLPYRAVIFIGLFIISLATYLNTISINHSFGMLLLTFAFMQSAGGGLIYSNVIVVSVKWFPAYRGLITGIIVALDSTASFAAMQMQTMYFNPDNVATDSNGYFTDPTVLNRLPIYFKMASLVFFLSGVTGVIMSFVPDPSTAQLLISVSRQAGATGPSTSSSSNPANLDNERTNYGALESGDESDLTSSGSSDGFLSTRWAENFLEKDVLGILREEIDNENIQQAPSIQSPTSEGVEPTPAQIQAQRKNYFGVRRAIKTKMALVLFITFGLSTESNYFIQAMGKPFGQTFIFDDHYLAAIISLSNLSNCFGSFLCGKMLDRYKFKRTMIVVNGVVSAAYFSFIFCTYWSPKVLYAIWSIIINFTSIGFFSSHLPEVMNKFGDRHATTIYGMIHIGPVISSLALSPIMEMLINYYGWFSTFITVGFLNFLSMLIIIVCYRTRKV